MNVKVESVGKNTAKFEIEVDAEVFEKGLQRSYIKNAKKFNVPGFRKGKAPRNMVERYYGVESLFEDAVNFICPEAYDEAVAQNNIIPVDRPEFDIKQIGVGQNLIFTATVVTKPEVTVGQYKDVEVEKVVPVVTDEDVDSELNKIADRNARVLTVEDRGIVDGDIAYIDFEGFIDGERYEKACGENYNLIIGSGHFIPGFEEQLIGAEKGSEVEVNVAFPEDYQSEDLKGKPALFKVKINDIKAKDLPALDDEFAKDVSEFDTLDEYKMDLRKKLEEAAEHKAKHELENKVIEKVVETAEVDIPEVMVDKQINVLLRDFDYRLRYQGLDLNRYMEVMGLTVDKLKGDFAERALQDVKTQLVIEKVGVLESIDVNEDEFNAEIKKLSENYKQTEEEFKKHLKDDDIEYIKKDLIFSKTIELLVQNAKIV